MFTQSPASNCGGYRIMDSQTQTPANQRVYASLSSARRAVDRMNQEHGSYRYFVLPI